MKVTIWINWDYQDICSNETQLKDAYDDSGCALTFEDFLSSYCANLEWGAIWEGFNNNTERDKILKEFYEAVKEDFWAWVDDHYEEITLEI